MIKTYKDLEVHRMAYQLGLDIFDLTRKFPKEELYSLTSQINRSARSISANIVEGWAKREYENIFKHHLISSIGSCAETENWLNYSKDFKYITDDEYSTLLNKLDIIGKMLTKLHQNWQTYDKN